MSALLAARALWETLKISWPTVWEASRGRLTQETCDRRLADWSRRLIEDARIRLEVRGLEAIDQERCFIVMSNHQSLYDIPVLYQSLPLRLRMAAKAELFRVPLWGKAMAEAGFVRIDRRRGEEARRALFEAGTRMKQEAVSLWIAPEGTRSPDGRLSPFKRGAFDLARTLALPILPVSIDGTIQVLGKAGQHIHRGQVVRVTVHAPLAPENFPERDAEWIETVRAQIASAVSS